MKNYAVFDYLKRFKEERKDVRDNRRFGYPKTHQTCGNLEKVRQLVRFDRRLTTRVIEE